MLSESSGEINCGNANILFESCFSSETSNASTSFVRNVKKIPLNEGEIEDYCK